MSCRRLGCSLSPFLLVRGAMASAADIGQALAAALQPILAEITKLAASNQGQRNSGGLVDTRGMGRPPSFDGNEKMWREWRGKMTAYLYATDAGAESSLKWVEVQSTPITIDLMKENCINQQGVVDDAELQVGIALNKKLYLILSDTCKGEPYRMVESAGYGNGFEAWRVLMRRYASKTPGTKRALLQNLFSLKPATSADTFETTLLNMEEMVRRYDSMATTSMSEDIRCAILVACCPRDLKEYLDMSSEEFVYSDLRNKVNTWMERKRDQHPKNLQQMEQRNSSGGPAPMDVGAAHWGTEDCAGDWCDISVHAVQNWGGYPDLTWHHHELSEEEVQYVHKGGSPKSKGKKGSKGKGGLPWMHPHTGQKGKGVPKGKGEKGSSGKGPTKGDGKGTGGYPGACHWCGVWGHTAKFCRQKDAYMEEQRRMWGQTASVEEEVHGEAGHADLGGLEAAGTHRDMGTFDLGSLLKQNRYASLAEDPDEQCCCTDYDKEFPNLTAQAMPKKARVLKDSSKKWQRKAAPTLSTIYEVELNSNEVLKQIDLTIDSGAAEHVVGPRDLPHVPTRPSGASAQGVTYVMANGTRTANRGEQQVTATTSTGQTCNFKAQVTGVHRPLMSVSRICDGGHRVVFESEGGYIESLESREKIHFRRESNVYRLRVDVPGEDFPRQGR